MSKPAPSLSSSSSSSSSSKATKASSSGTSSLGADVSQTGPRGCMVVGQYADENELCGGKLFDMGLQGYDGESPGFSSWE